MSLKLMAAGVDRLYFFQCFALFIVDPADYPTKKWYLTVYISVKYNPVRVQGPNAP